MGLLDKFLGFVNGDGTETPKGNSPAPTTFTLQENTSKPLEVEDVETFLTELYQYYANDIYRIESKMIDPEACTDVQVKLLKVVVRQKEEALKKIKALLSEVIKEKSVLTELERKSSYTFYEQLKSDTMEKLRLKVFKIFAKMKSINVASELDEIILNKINKLRADWKISPDIDIPDVADVRIIDVTDEMEAYSFGDMKKEFKVSGKEIKLSDEISDKIDLLEISIDFDSLPDYLWIQTSIIERWQIDLLQRTAVFPNTYESTVSGISYDVISKIELENYIKGFLRILFSRGRYLLFSIILPNADIKNATSNFISVSKRKVTVNNIAAFMLYERNQIPDENYLVKYLDRFSIPDKLVFKQVSELRSEFLPQYIDY
ncbi:MAG: hypothetical protein Q4D02_07030 [Clostridia bacterium]|nr:hypothetical protein [Clostridia bacterium]